MKCSQPCSDRSQVIPCNHPFKISGVMALLILGLLPCNEDNIETGESKNWGEMSIGKKI